MKMQITVANDGGTIVSQIDVSVLATDNTTIPSAAAIDAANRFAREFVSKWMHRESTQIIVTVVPTGGRLAD